VSDGFTSYKAFVGDPPRTRWGDYGAAVADGSSIWIASEYINQTWTLTEWFANAGPQLGNCGGTRTALGNWGHPLQPDQTLSGLGPNRSRLATVPSKVAGRPAVPAVRNRAFLRQIPLSHRQGR
jgi:hypothetical protein